MSKLLIFDGETLGITADVPDGGSVSVAVLDEAGNQLATCEPIRGTVTDGRVKWKGVSGLVSLSSGQIRLRFELREAKLYGFQSLAS